VHLIYLDESGNSGANLEDPQQPVFLLCAMVVPEQSWQPLEADLSASLGRRFPKVAPPLPEVHGSDLRNGRGVFAGVPVADRVALRNEWMDIASQHGVRLLYRAIEKRRYRRWLVEALGPGGSGINPHVAAFALLAGVANDYLRSLPGSPLGMFISDENREIVQGVEHALRVFRAAVGTLRLTQIIEKVFFIQSHLSLPLQLCDLFALTLRKLEEGRIGLPVRTVDEGAFGRAERLVHRGGEATRDVIDWLARQRF
jgi:hypothetical protein